MTTELPEMDFQRFWRRLQQLGLNAYEARSYLVLIGHPRFKAIELAARAHVPRQKIYEVLDSLVEKGFAQVVQERPNCSRRWSRAWRCRPTWRAARKCCSAS